MGLVESTLEDAWRRAPPGVALIPRRVDRFDPTCKLMVEPIEYEHRAFEVTDEPPSQQWIREGLLDFVLGEFGTASARGSCPPRPRIQDHRIVSDETAISYLNYYTQMVYGDVVESVLSAAGSNMVQRLHALLRDPILGNRDNQKNLGIDWFAQKVSPLIRGHLRLQFIVPSFPFKNQSVFRTEADPGQLDMGELALLARMHALVLAMYQVHPYGADWIIATDGTLYAKTLRIELAKVQEYHSRLTQYRDFMNLGRTIHIVDLNDMVHRLRSKAAGADVFGTTSRAIGETLRNLLKSDDSLLKEKMNVLVRGLKWNVNIRDVTVNLGWEDLWLVMNSEVRSDVPAHLREPWDTIATVATEAAIEYAAINLAVRFFDVYGRFFPEALRATVHPKPMQVAVPRLGDVYPWNGVAVRVPDASGFRFESWPLYSLLKHTATPVAYRFNSSNAPFFYEVGPPLLAEANDVGS